MTALAHLLPNPRPDATSGVSKPFSESSQAAIGPLSKLLDGKNAPLIAVPEDNGLTGKMVYRGGLGSPRIQVAHSPFHISCVDAEN